jgi:hypothetical protein
MKKLSRAIVASVFLGLLLITTVFALTIVVDGIREAEWASGGTISDGNEASIVDSVDVVTFQWTNDSNNFYFLVETAANTEWDRPSSPDDPYMWFCINSDNNTSTGSSLPGVCQASGYDYYVNVEGPAPSIAVYDANFVAVMATTQIATAGAITEMSVDLAALGFDANNCGLAPTGVYLDGRTTDPDDNVADGGDVPVTCGSPTAINLVALDGSGVDNSVIALVLFIGMLLVLGAATFLGIVRQRV